MPSEVTAVVRGALADLVAVLDATARGEGPDRLLAARAAANIRATIAWLAEAGDAHFAREAIKQAWYDTSERGIFEWSWSAETEAMLRAHVARLDKTLLRTDRTLRRKPRAI